MRLDIQMEQAMAEVHHVEDFGRLPQPGQQGAARDAGLSDRLVVAQLIVQALVGQLHDHDENAIDDLDTVHGEKIRVTNGSDDFEGLQLRLGVGAFAVERHRACSERF